MACKNCHRSTSAPYKFAFECNYCGQTHPAEPRCRFDIDLTDRSGTITASIFGDLAEKLLSFSAIEAMEYSKKDEVLPLENVHAQLRSKRFIAQIRASPTAVSDGKQRYTIVYYYPEETTQGSSQFISHPDCSSSLTHAEQSPLSQALAAQIESPGPANKADKPRTSAVRLSLDEKFEICSNMAEEASTDTSHGSTKKLKRSN